MAIDLGMVVQQLKIGNSSFGWANTRMTPDTVQKYREAIQSLKTAIESQLEKPTARSCGVVCTKVRRRNDRHRQPD